MSVSDQFIPAAEELLSAIEDFVRSFPETEEDFLEMLSRGFMVLPTTGEGRIDVKTLDTIMTSAVEMVFRTAAKSLEVGIGVFTGNEELDKIRLQELRLIKRNLELLSIWF